MRQAIQGVVAMAHPDPASDARRAHAAAQPLMHALATISDAPDRRPKILLGAERLAALGSPEAAVEAGRRQQLDPVQRHAEDAVRRQLQAADQRAAHTGGAIAATDLASETGSATPSWRHLPGLAAAPGDGAWRHAGRERPQQDRENERRRNEQHEQQRDQGQQHER